MSYKLTCSENVERDSFWLINWWTNQDEEYERHFINARSTL